MLTLLSGSLSSGGLSGGLLGSSHRECVLWSTRNELSWRSDCFELVMKCGDEGESLVVLYTYASGRVDEDATCVDRWTDEIKTHHIAADISAIHVTFDNDHSQGSHK